MVTNHPRNHKPCTLRPGKICSPSQGPCCTKDCSLKQGDLCREDNGCRDASFCGGSSPYCPPSINKPNKTICKDEFVCFKGECTGSICIAYGLDSCQCERGTWRSRYKILRTMLQITRRRSAVSLITLNKKFCAKLHKFSHANSYVCVLSSFDWNVPPFNIPDMYAKPGTPCDNYKGYCDVFQKCREMAITRLFGRQARRHSSKKNHKKSSSSSKKKKKKSKTIIHKSGTGSAGQFLTTANVNANNEGANHVVHPTVVRANIPFKRRVNEVRRAATKAKRVARSQLGRPCKKSGSSSKRAEASGAVTSPTDSEKSLNNPDSKVTSPSKTREKKAMSSRFSIISFKLRPKQLNQDKTKTNKVYDKRKVSIPGGRSKSKGQNRSRSPDKKRKAFHSPTDPKDKDVRSRSPSKRLSLEDDKRKSKSKPYGPEMILRSVSPEKGRKHKVKSPEKSYKLPEGNWLINKFLADEEKLAKPIISGSIAGSLNGSMCSINGTANVSPVNGSPVSHTRHGSKRALIPAPNHASPIRGIVNEAFVGSPRNMRTHSSLRVTKSVSPEEKDMNSHLSSSKYRRSISMVAYNGQLQSPDKRKRSTIDEGSLEKRRRFSSPEKPIKLTSSNNSVEKENENDVGSRERAW
ncbi:Disintegrin and metalloproteinase domain-containing protein 10 [Armadillidium nasatum]|uniref:Disintegrin and metalloproteinase domain-containing protein 10 n=1 Tax=Armadillidium nasatum TaxID=96803 RepID=A0A5N5THT7_9CRUS|nr:Disintegrin and metalloproteinase domain-containing protein 10 [Armadillidium nasatum]